MSQQRPEDASGNQNNPPSFAPSNRRKIRMALTHTIQAQIMEMQYRVFLLNRITNLKK